MRAIASWAVAWPGQVGAEVIIGCIGGRQHGSRLTKRHTDTAITAAATEKTATVTAAPMAMTAVMIVVAPTTAATSNRPHTNLANGSEASPTLDIAAYLTGS